jgi:hypothetical protein
MFTYDQLPLMYSFYIIPLVFFLLSLGTQHHLSVAFFNYNFGFFIAIYDFASCDCFFFIIIFFTDFENCYVYIIVVVWTRFDISEVTVDYIH